MPRSFFILCALALLAGCETVEKEFIDPFRDAIVWGLPKLVSPLPDGASIYIERPIGAASQGVYARNGMTLVRAFEQEFRRRGAKPVVGEKAIADIKETFARATAASCRYALVLDIRSWAYGEAGWSGLGGRDEVVFDAMLLDAERERVLSRAQIEVTNSIINNAPGGGDADSSVAPVIRRYVGKLYSP